jgi:hypothetical protein
MYGGGNLHKLTLHGTETRAFTSRSSAGMYLGRIYEPIALEPRILLGHLVPRFGSQNGHYLCTIWKYFTKEDLAPETQKDIVPMNRSRGDVSLCVASRCIGAARRKLGGKDINLAATMHTRQRPHICIF